MSRKTALRLASEFVDLVKKTGVPVTGAILFGSWAKGRADENSDIDVCVVSPQFGRDYLSEMTKLLNIAQKIDSRIEAVPFSPDDVRDVYSSLANEIRLTGTPVATD